MRKLRGWFQFLQDIFKLIGQMMALAWRAQPSCFVLLLGLQLFQGGIPLASAWFSKGIFDALGLGLHGQPFAHLVPTLIFLLTAQAIVFVIGQIISPVNRYVSSELDRGLTL